MPIRLIFLMLSCPALIHAGEIALSFDDAPKPGSPVMTGSQRTERLLGALAEHDVPRVVFFCTTKHIDPEHDGRKRLERYTEAGHLLANHSHGHRRIADLGVEGYLADVRQADQVLREMEGFVPWFRYPFLDQGRDHETRDRLIEGLEAMGYTHGYVTVDNYDWYLDKLYVDAVRDGVTVDMDALRDAYVGLLWETIQLYDSFAVETIGRSPKHVLLLHENDLAALFIGDLITHLRANGWEIISPEDAYSDPIAKERPRVLMGQGRVAAIARARGFEGRLSHVHEDTAWLDRYVAEKRIIVR